MSPTHPTRDRILATLEEKRDDLRRLGVVSIGLFGSFLKGHPGEGSDLDFLVQLEPATFDAYMDTKFFLEGLFGREVDLVTEAALKPALRHVRDEAVYASGL